MDNVLIADSTAMDLAIKVLAEKICSEYVDEPVALVGLVSRGDSLAQRLAAKLLELGKNTCDVGVLDVSLYRDDLSRRESPPELKLTKLEFALDEMRVILVDDVLYTGRTVRAALDAVCDYGRPMRIQLAVLVNRPKGREMPIQADYFSLETDGSEDEVIVQFQEDDGQDKVLAIKIAIS